MHPRQVCGHRKQRQGFVDIHMPAVLQTKLPSLLPSICTCGAGIHNTSTHKRLHNLSALQQLRWQRSRLTSWRCIVRRPPRKMGMAIPSQVRPVCQNWSDLSAMTADQTIKQLCTGMRACLIGSLALPLCCARALPESPRNAAW